MTARWPTPVCGCTWRRYDTRCEHVWHQALALRNAAADDTARVRREFADIVKQLAS